MANPPTTRPVALITGASRGIGEAAARALAARGYALALAARSEGPLLRLAGELSRQGAPALPVPTDLRRPEDALRLARVALEHFGRVDALVNNAGVGSRHRSVARAEPDEIRELLAVNLEAPIALTRALLPQMLARRDGAMVFVGSVAGQIPLPGSALYTTTKFGLRGFALALRREVQHRGVRVTYVAPGFVDTEMVRSLRGIPKIPAAAAGQAIANVVAHPRRELTIPRYYALAVALDRWLPWVGDLALRFRAR